MDEMVNAYTYQYGYFVVDFRRNGKWHIVWFGLTHSRHEIDVWNTIFEKTELTYTSFDLDMFHTHIDCGKWPHPLHFVDQKWVKIFLQKSTVQNDTLEVFITSDNLPQLRCKIHNEWLRKSSRSMWKWLSITCNRPCPSCGKSCHK